MLTFEELVEYTRLVGCIIYYKVETHLLTH